MQVAKKNILALEEALQVIPSCFSSAPCTGTVEARARIPSGGTRT